MRFPALANRNYASGLLNDAGTWGNYWSSVQNDSNNAYDMNFNNGNLNPNNNNYKTNGFSVRCVRREFTTLILHTKVH